MPAAETKGRLKRRANRKDVEDYRFDATHARELEQKRARGEVSCAECRRLKIKCDKQIPCQSCNRRGCSALCPNGSLATGQGTRFVLAATEHLHKKMSRFGLRIRELEDALASLHAQHSSDPHPLLREDVIMNPEHEEDHPMPLDDSGIIDLGCDAPLQNRPPSSEVNDILGTLSISDNGIARFFGATGGTESLLRANLDNGDDTTHTSRTSQSPGHSPPPISDSDGSSFFSRSFPFTPAGQSPPVVQEQLEAQLPSYDRAHALCTIYYNQVAWLFHTLTREQIVDEMLPAIYNRKEKAQLSASNPPSNPGSPGADTKKSPPPIHPLDVEETYSSPHDLALVFTVFAIASLVQPDSPETFGEHYNQLACAALSLQPVLEKPSVATIQTLHLMSVYNGMAGTDMKHDTSIELTWSLRMLAAQLSQSIGLHRDSSRWGLPPKAVRRRRIVFWDLFLADAWESLNNGRPPCFSLTFIDCGYPEPLDEDSQLHYSQCRFAAEVVSVVLKRTLTPEAPSYATIMELDKLVRDFSMPDVEGKDNGSMFSIFLSTKKETVLMYLHRNFFAQAIIEHPENPLKSSYAPSFLASYRASSAVLKSVRDQFNLFPVTCARVWLLWTYAFSAAVVFGTIVTRGPQSPLAQSAMTELEQACILFAKASVYNIRATRALPILTKLSEKARYALATVQKGGESKDQGEQWEIKQEDTEDELSILAGHSRFVYSKKPQERSTTPEFVLYPPTHRLEPKPQQDLSSQQEQLPSPRQSKRRCTAGVQQQQHENFVLPPMHQPLQPPPPPPMVSSWPPPQDHPDDSGFISIPPLHDQIRLTAPFMSTDRGNPNGSWNAHSPSIRQQNYAHSHSHGPASGTGAHFESHGHHPRYFHTPPPPPPSSTSQPGAGGAHPQTTGPAPPNDSLRQRPRTSSHHHHHHPPPSHLLQDFSPGAYNGMHFVPPPPTPVHQQHHHSNYGMNGLANLGLAPRDSGLGERWGSFMEDSGLLEGIDFRG